MAKFVWSLVGAFTFLAAIAGPTTAATTPAQKCAASKQKATGKKIASKMSCHSKAKAKNVAVDPNCLTKAEAKFSAAFAKLGLTCPGAAATIEGLADDCVTILVGDAPGNGKCPSGSAKAAGKAVGGELGCTAKEITRPGTLGACHVKSDTKLSSALTKAGGCGSYPTVQTDVHNCRDSVSNALPPTTTTSTTSSTSTSTSTSTSSTTTTSLLSTCRLDPSRTLFAGGSGGGVCGDFSDDQTLCEKAFHLTRNGGNFATCFYDSGTCAGCGPNSRRGGRCANTCEEPPPSCPGDATRTLFAGFSGTGACHVYDGDALSCGQAFHVTGSDGRGTAASCYYDPGSQACNGCGPSNLGSGNCINTCPVCQGDPSRTTYAGGPNSSACHQFDGDQSTCEAAFHTTPNTDQVGKGVQASCWYDTNTLTCAGCGPAKQAEGDCVNSCPVCAADPTRTFVGGPGNGACHNDDNNLVACSDAFHLGQDGAGFSTCQYDPGSGDCFGCGPSRQTNDDCANTCEGAICGDNVLNQPGEQCDGSADAACASIGLGCRADCKCERCGNATVDPGEACDTALPGSCAAGETCNNTCTACKTVCGDGIIGTGEACDPPFQQGVCPTGQSCNFSCTGCQTICGDGLVGPGEVCDPPGLQGSCGVGEICSGCTACVDCSAATVIGSAGGVFVGTTVGGTTQFQSVCGFNSTASPERLYRWTPTVAHFATIQTCGGTTNFDTVVSVRIGSCLGGESFCNDNACGSASAINPLVFAGNTYFIVVDGVNGASGNFTLTVSPSGAFLDPPF